jgi:hypothetical protein
MVSLLNQVIHHSPPTHSFLRSMTNSSDSRQYRNRCRPLLLLRQDFHHFKVRSQGVGDRLCRVNEVRASPSPPCCLSSHLVREYYRNYSDTFFLQEPLSSSILLIEKIWEEENRLHESLALGGVLSKQKLFEILSSRSLSQS